MSVKTQNQYTKHKKIQNTCSTDNLYHVKEDGCSTDKVQQPLNLFKSLSRTWILQLLFAKQGMLSLSLSNFCFIYTCPVVHLTAKQLLERGTKFFSLSRKQTESQLCVEYITLERKQVSICTGIKLLAGKPKYCQMTQ